MLYWLLYGCLSDLFACYILYYSILLYNVILVAMVTYLTCWTAVPLSPPVVEHPPRIAYQRRSRSPPCTSQRLRYNQVPQGTRHHTAARPRKNTKRSSCNMINTEIP